MTQLIHFICSLILLIVFNSVISAEEQTIIEKPITTIEGNWEGNLVVIDNKSIRIPRNFKTSDNGELNGFQGSFSGFISETGIKDTCNSQRDNVLGEKLPLKRH